MIELPLNQINAKSPYEVSYAPNGDFVFATNLGIHYLISFEAEQPVGGCATFQFVIQKLEHLRYDRQALTRNTARTVASVFEPQT